MFIDYNAIEGLLTSFTAVGPSMLHYSLPYSIVVINQFNSDCYNLVQNQIYTYIKMNIHFLLTNSPPGKTFVALVSNTKHAYTQKKRVPK